jgi:hypothetical protein
MPPPLPWELFPLIFRKATELPNDIDISKAFASNLEMTSLAPQMVYAFDDFILGVQTKLAILHVCKVWHDAVVPLLYEDVYISSPHSLELFSWSINNLSLVRQASTTDTPFVLHYGSFTKRLWIIIPQDNDLLPGLPSPSLDPAPVLSLCENLRSLAIYSVLSPSSEYLLLGNQPRL